MAEKDKPSATYLVHYPKVAHDSLDPLTTPTLTPEEEAKAWRKIDIRLMPILALLYLFSYLDRGASHSSQLLARISPSSVGNIGQDTLPVVQRQEG